MHEYVIPVMHLRNQYPRKGKVIVEEIPGIKYEDERVQQTSVYQKVPTPQERLLSPDLPDDGIKRGLCVAIVGVRNHIAKNNLRVMAGLI
jgi:hypothetical protein